MAIYAAAHLHGEPRIGDWFGFYPDTLEWQSLLCTEECPAVWQIISGREIREPHSPAESKIFRWGRPVAKPVALGNLRLTLLLQGYEKLAVIPLHQEQEMIRILGPVNIFQDILN
jgi:hypothetical protein